MNEKMTAMINDQRLMELAKYKATNGLLEEATQTDIVKAFTSMKKRILSGRSTLAKLEENTYGKLGVQEEIDDPLEGMPLGFGAGKGMPMLPSKNKGKEIEGFNTKRS